MDRKLYGMTGKEAAVGQCAFLFAKVGCWGHQLVVSGAFCRTFYPKLWQETQNNL